MRVTAEMELDTAEGRQLRFKVGPPGGEGDYQVPGAVEKKAVTSAAGLRLGKQEGRMDFRDRHVVVTGGTGALGRAVVDALLAAGAHCYVPYRQEKEKESLPRGALSLIPAPSLADEAVVRKLYGGLPALWASIHIAGG